MLFYESRKRQWVEKSIQIESLEQLKKLVVVSILTGGGFEIESEEEAEMLIRLLPDLEPPFKMEAEKVLQAYITAQEIISKLL